MYIDITMEVLVTQSHQQSFRASLAFGFAPAHMVLSGNYIACYSEKMCLQHSSFKDEVLVSMSTQ